MKEPNNKVVSLYAIACVTVIAITAMLLTTVANAQDYQAYQQSVQTELMTNYESGLVYMGNKSLMFERDLRIKKVTRQGIAGLFFPVFLIPAAVNAVRIAKIDIERERRARFFNQQNL
jgi:hypothetical protein